AGGGDRGFGDGGFAGGDRSFGGDNGVHNWGGGTAGGFAGGGVHDWGSGGMSNKISEGGFGHIAGLQNRTPTQMNNTSLHNQGDSVRNSFNNDTVNVNKTNSFNSSGW